MWKIGFAIMSGDRKCVCLSRPLAQGAEWSRVGVLVVVMGRAWGISVKDSNVVVSRQYQTVIDNQSHLSFTIC